MVVTRTALRFYGGKAAIAEWIVSVLPPHESYLEPFGGGASILLNKPRVPLETYNDLDGVVTTFFRVLRNDHAALTEAIRLTPFGRTEVEAAVLDEPGITDLERARRLYVRSWQTVHGAPTREKTGWRCEREDGGNARSWSSTTHLAALAERLRGVQIEERPALETIARFDTPTCLLLVDPPYVPDTRGRRWATRSYAHEMTEADHRELAQALHCAAGMVVLCGYASPLYEELYGSWIQVTRAALMQSHGTATEVLWLNPKAAATQRQLSLAGVA